MENILTFRPSFLLLLLSISQVENTLFCYILLHTHRFLQHILHVYIFLLYGTRNTSRVMNAEKIHPSSSTCRGLELYDLCARILSLLQFARVIFCPLEIPFFLQCTALMFSLFLSSHQVREYQRKPNIFYIYIRNFAKYDTFSTTTKTRLLRVLFSRTPFGQVFKMRYEMCFAARKLHHGEIHYQFVANAITTTTY